MTRATFAGLAVEVTGYDTTGPYPKARVRYLASPNTPAEWVAADAVTVIPRRTHFCGPCNAWTEHEREATLPPEYRCGDPDYEDRSKCGQCGEHYLCQECGAPWDVEHEECEAVLDHGHHGPEED